MDRVKFMFSAAFCFVLRSLFNVSILYIFTKIVQKFIITMTQKIRPRTLTVLPILFSLWKYYQIAYDYRARLMNIKEHLYIYLYI